MKGQKVANDDATGKSTWDPVVDPHLKITIFETANSKMTLDSVRPYNPSSSTLDEKREEDSSNNDNRKGNSSKKSSDKADERVESSPITSKKSILSRWTTPIPKLAPSRLDSNNRNNRKKKKQLTKTTTSSTTSTSTPKSMGAPTKKVAPISTNEPKATAVKATTTTKTSPRVASQNNNSIHQKQQEKIPDKPPRATETSKSPEATTRNNKKAKKWIPGLLNKQRQEEQQRKKEEKQEVVLPSMTTTTIEPDKIETQLSDIGFKAIEEKIEKIQRSLVEAKLAIEEKEITEDSKNQINLQTDLRRTATLDDVEVDLRDIELEAMEKKIKEDIQRARASRLKARSLLVAFETEAPKNETKRIRFTQRAYSYARDAQRIFDNVKKARDEYDSMKAESYAPHNYPNLSSDVALVGTLTECIDQDAMNRRLVEVSRFSNEDISHIALDMDILLHGDEPTGDLFDQLAIETNHILNMMTLYNTVSEDERINAALAEEERIGHAASGLTDATYGKSSIWIMDDSIASARNLLNDFDNLLEEGITCGGFCTRICEGEEENRGVPYKIVCTAPQAAFENETDSIGDMESSFDDSNTNDTGDRKSHERGKKSKFAKEEEDNIKKRQEVFETGSLAGSDISAAAGSTRANPFQFLFCCGDPMEAVSV